AELDAVVADRPVWLERVDGHAGWANSAAMRIAGVTDATADPAGGRIERVAGSRKPAGVFVDAASGLIAAKVPVPRPAGRDLALQKTEEILFSNGAHPAADMGTTIEDWQSYRRAGDRAWLKTRTRAYAAGTGARELIAGLRPSPWLYDDKL